MPVVDLNDDDSLPGYVIPPVQSALDNEEKDPDLFDTVSAAFNLENTVVSTARFLNEDKIETADDPLDYDPFEEIKGTKYEQFASHFIESQSSQNTKLIQERLDQEINNRETLMQSGSAGIAMGFAAGLLDPVILVPVGGEIQLGRAVTKLGTALRTARAGAIGATASESILQSTQQDRSYIESAINIGGAAALSGLLGGAVATLSAKRFNEVAANLETQIAVPDIDTPDPTSIKDVVVTQDGISVEIKNPTTGETELQPIKLKDENIVKKLAFENPMMRTMVAQSQTGRRIMSSLVPVPRTEANTKGIVNNFGPSIQTRITMEDAELSKALQGIDKQFQNYYFGDKSTTNNKPVYFGAVRSEIDRAFSKSTKLTYAEFKREVGKAVAYGSHENPFVEAAARDARVFFERYKQMGMDAQVWAHDPTPPGSEGYFPRVFLKDRLIQRRGEFIDINSRWIEGEDAARIDSVEEKISDLSNDDFNGVRAALKRLDDPADRELLEVLIEKFNKRSERVTKVAQNRPIGINIASFADFVRIIKKAKKSRKGELTPEDRAALNALGKKYDRVPGRTEVRRKDVARQIINRIVGTPDGRVPYDAHLPENVGKTGVKKTQTARGSLRGPIKSRVYNIPTKEIEDFLEWDIEHVMRLYHRSIVPDVMLTKEYGDVDLTHPIARIEAEYDELMDGVTDEKQLAKLQKEKSAVIRDVAAVRDRLRHVYAINGNEKAAQVEQAVLNLNYLRLLGGMTFSAIPDIGKPILEHGMKRVFGPEFKLLVSDFKNFRKQAKDVQEAGTALDMVLNTRAMQMSEIMDNYGYGSKFGRGLNALTNKFGLISLMSPWNETIKQFTGLVTRSRILQASLDTIDNKISPAELERLASSGIDKTYAKTIANQYNKFGEEIDGIKVPNFDKWEIDKPEVADAMLAFRGAIVDETDRIIVTPGAGDRPLWMSRPGWRIIGQFKSFAFSSTTKTLMTAIQVRDAAALQGIMSMLVLGSVVTALKTREDTSEKDITWWIHQSIDRSGVLGSLMEYNNMSERLSRNTLGLSAITGQVSERYTARNSVASLLGPTFGLAQDFFNVAGNISAGDIRDSDVRAVRRLIPLQNVFYLRKLFDELEGGAASVIVSDDNN
jgi:hypothetical protein